MSGTKEESGRGNGRESSRESSKDRQVFDLGTVATSIRERGGHDRSSLAGGVAKDGTPLGGTLSGSDDETRRRHDPAALAAHYSAFRVGERVLLSGHSHQAWPDVAMAAQQQAWLDAAKLVDDKWDRAFAVADSVRDGFRLLLDDPDGHIALGQNTHELVTRFLSALPLRERPRLVTTDGEFHTVRRQLHRLAEEGIEVVKVTCNETAGGDATSLAERLAAETDSDTAAVLVSSVLFQDARIVEGLDGLVEACVNCGAELLVDAYHSLNVAPFSVSLMGLNQAFVVGGGYKYCQLGEGNCFLRFPHDCRLRPVLTGWFAEFDALTDGREPGAEPTTKPVATHYAQGHLRFAGSTYDPVSHYRAQAVFRFFAEMGLNPQCLRQINQQQVRRLATGVDALDVDPAVLRRDLSLPLHRRGGFLALESPYAGTLCRGLKLRGVHSDYRGRYLRLGPAPYLTNTQLDDSLWALEEAIRALHLSP